MAVWLLIEPDTLYREIMSIKNVFWREMCMQFVEDRCVVWPRLIIVAIEHVNFVAYM